MEDVILPSLLYGLVVFVLLLVVAFIKRLVYRGRMPRGERREQLLAEIRRMRSGGATYQDCLTWLRSQGIGRAVADALLGQAESSPDAPATARKQDQSAAR